MDEDDIQHQFTAPKRDPTYRHSDPNLSDQYSQDKFDHIYNYTTCSEPQHYMELLSVDDDSTATYANNLSERKRVQFDMYDDCTSSSEPPPLPQRDYVNLPDVQKPLKSTKKKRAPTSTGISTVDNNSDTAFWNWLGERCRHSRKCLYWTDGLHREGKDSDFGPTTTPRSCRSPGKTRGAKDSYQFRVFNAVYWVSFCVYIQITYSIIFLHIRMRSFSGKAYYVRLNLAHDVSYFSRIYILLDYDTCKRVKRYIKTRLPTVYPCYPFNGKRILTEYYQICRLIHRGGGGCHCHSKLYHIQVSRPEKSTLNEVSRVDQKTPLTGDMGQLSHPKWGWLPCLHDQLFPKPGFVLYFHTPRVDTARAPEVVPHFDSI